MHNFLSPEQRLEFVPPCHVLLERQVDKPSRCGTVRHVRRVTTVVNRKLLEVRQHAQSQPCSPRVAAELIRSAGALLEVHRGLLRLDEEFAPTSDPKGVV